tara:strand:- start:110 stop:295 length:186 start_codon:yes stop_codon:yes gene_type:complete
MANKQQIKESGIPNQSGLEIYAEVEIANGVMILVPITMQDNYNNAHKVLRRDLGNKPIPTV